MHYLLSLLAAGALISSDEVSFVSDLLTLNGHVSIDHPLGHFEADKVTVEKMENDKENRLSHATFEHGVKISLSDSRYMECDLADFDFTRLEAVLKATDDAFVTISDQNGELPLLLKAKNIRCKFLNEETKALQSLSGETLVELVIAGLYHISADKVEYLPQGMLHFFGTDEESTCQIKTPKETFLAKKISYDTHSKTFSFDELDGVVNGCRIQAKHTLFTKGDRSIVFDQGATLEPLNLGLISSPGLIQIFLDEAENITKVESPSEPLCFMNDFLHIESSALQLGYTAEKSLKHISFIDHVKITPNASFFPLRYATAQMVDYNHEENSLTLTGSEEEPVILGKDSLLMNAEKLVVLFDKESHKSKIQGEGIVNFSFPIKSNWKEEVFGAL